MNKQIVISQRTLMLALIAVIVLGGGLYAYKQLAPPEAQEAQGPIYSTEEVIRGDISVGVETTGRLDPTHGGGIRVPGDNYRGGTSVSYILDEVFVEDGDEVQKGQILARLVSPNLDMQIESLRDKLKTRKEELADMTGLSVDQLDSINPSKGITLRAPIGGRISNLDANEGDELKLGHVIGRIVDDSRFEIRAKLTPTEFKMVKEGQRVVLKFSFFEGLYDGQMTDINPNAVPDNRDDEFARGFVYWITIEGENPGLVQPGMKVSVGIPQAEDNSSVYFFANQAKVENFIDEKRIISRAEAIVTEVYVHNMEVVEKGTPVVSMAGADVQQTLQDKIEEIRELELELRQQETQLNQMEITATIDGVVGSIHKAKGETCRPGEWIGNLFNTGEMMLWAQVDDIDIVHVQQDAPVKITVDAIPGETFQGKVMHVSTMGEDRNGITMYRVNIKVEGGPKMRPGMQATAYIDAGSAEDVLLAPLEAIFEEDGKSMVEVLKPDGAVKLCPVKLGLMNDRYAEVKEGIEEGDLLITGSSADLLPSEHIKSNDTIIPTNNGNDDNQNQQNNGDNN